MRLYVQSKGPCIYAFLVLEKRVRARGQMTEIRSRAEGRGMDGNVIKVKQEKDLRFNEFDRFRYRYFIDSGPPALLKAKPIAGRCHRQQGVC